MGGEDGEEKMEFGGGKRASRIFRLMKIDVQKSLFFIWFFIPDVQKSLFFILFFMWSFGFRASEGAYVRSNV